MPDDEQAVIERFANMARIMAEDLLAEEPLLSQGSWVAHRPRCAWALEKTLRRRHAVQQLASAIEDTDTGRLTHLVRRAHAEIAP